jgi:ubiquinone/menaquinone biosynthesis C-methylase UbiE
VKLFGLGLNQVSQIHLAVEIRGGSSLAEDLQLLYRDRKMSEGYPGLSEPALTTYRAALAGRPEERPRVEMIVACLDRLIDMHGARKILVVGCGPQPDVMRVLGEMGYTVLGVDPVPEVLEAARAYLGQEGSVLEGSAESLPNESESQDVVVLESVLEHVDSVGASLAEAHRVLAPRGVAYIITTNRQRLGNNMEFNVRFFQMLPEVVKESYVFRHLHYEPSLANYAERPAVHWFTYAELCRLGREAGFFQFYSHLDLKDAQKSNFAGGSLGRRLKASVLKGVQRSAWLRSAALTQLGGQIFMVKRP